MLIQYFISATARDAWAMFYWPTHTQIKTVFKVEPHEIEFARKLAKEMTEIEKREYYKAQQRAGNRQASIAQR